MHSSDGSPRVRFVVPGDPDQNTGGYRYIRRLADAISDSGVHAEVIGLAGDFPRPDRWALIEMDHYLERCPSSALVVLDGLAMSAMPEVVARHAQRLHLVALIHHPLADESGLSERDCRWFFEQERRALAKVRQIITTSSFTARRLADFGVTADRITVAEPGVAISAGLQRAQKTHDSIPQILCVGHLSPRKAQHQLVRALQNLKGLPWRCTLAGALDRDRRYSQQVAQAIQSAGLSERIVLAGEADDERLTELYEGADMFVLPSEYEGYGMVIDEATAAGLPILSSDGGALAETALRPGVQQYPAGNVEALTDRLRDWLSNPEVLAANAKLAQRQSLRLNTWEQAAATVLTATGLKTSATANVFEGGWLALREPADHRARSAALTDTLNQWFQQRTVRSADGAPEGPVTIVDLGAGRGSNAVYLSPRLQVPQRWLLLDQDASLLAEAQTRLSEQGITASIVEQWLSAESLPRQIPEQATLITASALIDLVSQTWLEALVDTAFARGAAVLVVLSYSGKFRLEPGHPDDGRVLALLNEHQQGEKGTGQALGPDAAEALRLCLQAAGYFVETRMTPWHLGRDDEALIGQLLNGWADAVSELIPKPDKQDRSWLRRWLADRRQRLAEGRLSVTVQHLDLLALPEGVGV